MYLEWLFLSLYQPAKGVKSLPSHCFPSILSCVYRHNSSQCSSNLSTYAPALVTHLHMHLPPKLWPMSCIWLWFPIVSMWRPAAQVLTCMIFPPSLEHQSCGTLTFFIFLQLLRVRCTNTLKLIKASLLFLTLFSLHLKWP